MDIAEKPPTLRQLMPDGFSGILAKDTGLDRPAISNLINLEQHTRRGWPEALALAQKHNPTGFTQWAAANPGKLLAKAAA